MTFHFLADPQREIPFLDLARTLAPLLAENPQDLAMKLRRARGWLARDIEADKADAIQNAIEEIGFPFHRIEATPLDVARPDMERAKECTIDEDSIEVELPFGVEKFSLADIQGLDLNLLGELHDEVEHDEQAASVRLIVESLQAPYTKQRLALLDHRATTEPSLHLFVSDPVRVLRLERGCRFPAYARDNPGHPWLDYFLTLVHTLLHRLPDRQISPETNAFWRTKEITCILCPHPEELEHRLGWIRALVRTGVWGES